MVNSSSVGALPDLWELTAQKFGDIIALQDPHAKPEVRLTYIELYRQIRQFATGLQALGVKSGAKIALFADNSPRWFIADQAVMMTGAANAVRSSQADPEELLYILEDSDSSSLIIEDSAALSRLKPDLGNLDLDMVILLSDEAIEPGDNVKIVNFPQLMKEGTHQDFEPVQQTPEMLATLIYTSGTTGKPKGVMLTHGNLLHQVNEIDTIIQPQPGEAVLSILPTWHSYERAAEYFLLSRGITQIYTSIRFFKDDLQRFKPHFMIAVPPALGFTLRSHSEKFPTKIRFSTETDSLFLKLFRKIYFIEAYCR